MKQKFNVTGMTCSACSAHVEKAVRQVEGVDSVSVNLLGNSMLVEYGGKFYDIKRIDNYEGYTDDISLYCKLSNDQNIEVTEPDAASV